MTTHKKKLINTPFDKLKLIIHHLNIITQKEKKSVIMIVIIGKVPHKCE